MKATTILILGIFLAACSNVEPEPTSDMTEITETVPALPPTTAITTTDTKSMTATNTVEATETAASAFEPTEQISTPPSRAPDVGRPVVFFQQEGGIAGLMLSWTIYSDGQISSEESPECLVDQDAVATLLEQAEEDGFFTLPERKPADICCDFFTLTLTINTGKMEKTVIVSEGDPYMPPELRDLLTSVQQLVNSCSP